MEQRELTHALLTPQNVHKSTSTKSNNLEFHTSKNNLQKEPKCLKTLLNTGFMNETHKAWNFITYNGPEYDDKVETLMDLTSLHHYPLFLLQGLLKRQHYLTTPREEAGVFSLGFSGLRRLQK